MKCETVWQKSSH